MSTQISLPIKVGEDTVRLSEFLVGDKYLVLVTRQTKPDGLYREMILNTNFSKLTRWHHLVPQPKLIDHFPELTDSEINFLKAGTIYDTVRNNHSTKDVWAVNYDK